MCDGGDHDEKVMFSFVLALMNCHLCVFVVSVRAQAKRDRLLLFDLNSKKVTDMSMSLIFVLFSIYEKEKKNDCMMSFGF